MPIFIFPIISLWKFKVAIATKVLKEMAIKKKKKKKLFIEATIMNISAKFQLHPLIASEELSFFIFSQI